MWGVCRHDFSRYEIPPFAYFLYELSSTSTERLYEVRHPSLVRDFDCISDIPEHCEGFWISKKWLKGMVGLLSLMILFNNMARLEAIDAQNACSCAR